MNYNFQKYKYICERVDDLSVHWQPHVYKLLQQLDKLARPRFIPLFLFNFLNKFKLINSEYKILYIKANFATLRIGHTILNKDAVAFIYETIDICNNTCEFCGNTNTSHVMVKSWLRNLCTTCKETKQYGSNIRNSTSNTKC